jgi:hypothetical protein
MPEPRIKTLEELRTYLNKAMQLEHATIPPYLTALYSIHPGTNSDAVHILRVVAVEEMLHLTLAANVLNAVGGTPNLSAKGFVPSYPTYLQTGETDFEVGLHRFSKEAVDTFIKIERPAQAPDETERVIHRHCRGGLCTVPGQSEVSFYSIGEFYEEIKRGLHHLHKELGRKLFSGDPKRQVSKEYFYSGGGQVLPVGCLETAEEALRLIIVQGEGIGSEIYDKAHEGELSHEYRFDQLLKGQYYQAENAAGKQDVAGNPTGPTFEVNWDAVYPIKKNAKLADYDKYPDIHAAAVRFNKAYAGVLAMLTEAFNGRPELLLEAVPTMFRIRNLMVQLMHIPLPNSKEKEHAAPTFEV